jgi:hypothetical protein
MMDEQINTAIADSIGGKRETEYGPLYSSPEGWTCNCPNFCGDLNAMHAAEGHLSRADRQFMGAVLVTVLNRRPEYVPAWRATARERAEAFLRTVGKWEEVQPC